MLGRACAWICHPQHKSLQPTKVLTLKPSTWPQPRASQDTAATPPNDPSVSAKELPSLLQHRLLPYMAPVGLGPPPELANFLVKGDPKASIKRVDFADEIEEIPIMEQSEVTGFGDVEACVAWFLDLVTCGCFFEKTCGATTTHKSEIFFCASTAADEEEVQFTPPEEDEQ